MRDGTTKKTPLVEGMQEAAIPRNVHDSPPGLTHSAGEVKHQASPQDGAVSRQEPADEALGPSVDADPAPWICPACGVSELREPEECPHCGVIPSKLRAQTRAQADGQPLSPITVDRSSAGKAKTSTTVIIGLVVCVALGLIAIKWYSGSRAATDKEVQRGSFQTAGQVKQFTLGNYQQDVMVASEKRPVLMEFFTRTCPVCKRMDPVLNDVARELGERASIGVVNPEERKLFQTFNIRMVPTIYVIRNREVYKSYIGFVSKEELVKDLLQLGSVGRTEGT